MQAYRFDPLASLEDLRVRASDATGEVAAIGEGVRAFAAGDRVT